MNHLQTSLLKVGLSIFEDLGFMLPTADLNSEQANAAFQAGVSIDFFGPIHGALVLQLNGEILPDLAANMLGEDEPPPLIHQHDALKELANVICGNLMPLISGSEAEFDLGAPQIRDAQFETDPKHHTAAAQQTIGLENGNAMLWLFISEASRANE
jgi:CheY-specific phosphatase CheX